VLQRYVGSGLGREVSCYGVVDRIGSERPRNERRGVRDDAVEEDRDTVDGAREDQAGERRVLQAAKGG
jgi:hypothetical protein